MYTGTYVPMPSVSEDRSYISTLQLSAEVPANYSGTMIPGGGADGACFGFQMVSEHNPGWAGRVM